MRSCLVALALISAGSSCTISRSITLPAARPLALGQPTGTSFAVTELSWVPPSSNQLAVHDFSGVVEAARAHSRDVLTQSESIGVAKAASEGPTYFVEIAVAHGETAGPNGLGTLPMLATLGLGTGVALTLLTAPPVALGLATGMLGVAAADSFIPSQTYAGTLTAEVRVRRAVDGVEVARRTCTVSWKEPLSSATWREGWASSLGTHVGELEQAVGLALRDVFLAAKPAAVAGAKAGGAAVPPEG